jgi:very-short-patch-repair endonuclease
MLLKKPVGIVRGQPVTKAKLALARQLRRTLTPQESQLWDQLRKNQLNGLHFRRQQIVDGFVVDFYCHQAGLVVELDGPVHLGQLDYDVERSRWLQARGLHVLRFTNAELEADLPGVLARIAQAAQERLAGDIE